MASPPTMTAAQLAVYYEDRRPALYGSLITLLVINNLFAAGRWLLHWITHYRHNFSFRRIFAEDYFILLGAICINAVIGNLLAATHYGLGLHSWRINAEDPNYPQNLSDTFKHVWITMILTGPTFTSIKLSILFFYRRLFLVHQTWLRIAWWTNVVYVILWLIGATGFYLFQCWPVQWYFMQYYQKYHRPPPYSIHGQCNATSTIHVAIPLIFGLFSDLMILLLPLATIFRLHVSRKSKIGLALVFSVGIIACLLDMVRIIELTTDTDDKVDPSYGVVIFLILSAATEVAAMVCACMPVIGPQAVKEYKRHHHPSYNQGSKFSKLSFSGGRQVGSFAQLGSSGTFNDDRIALNGIDSRAGHKNNGNNGQQQKPSGMIWVENEIEVTVGDGGQEEIGHDTSTAHAI